MIEKEIMTIGVPCKRVGSRGVCRDIFYLFIYLFIYLFNKFILFRHSPTHNNTYLYTHTIYTQHTLTHTTHYIQ